MKNIVQIPAALIVLISLLVLSFIGCDNRRIYEKSSLTSRVISKDVKDTTIISDAEAFKALTLAQAKSQASFLFNTNDVDSIYQTNYWLKTNDGEIVETRKRLDKTIMKYKKGRLVYQSTYQIDGDLSLSNQYYFDYDGLLLAQHETNSALNQVEEQLVYSKDNMVIGKVHMNGKGKNVANSSIVYSPEKNTSTETIDWLVSETQSKIVREYDSRGNLIKKMIHQALMNKPLTDTTEQVFEYQYNTLDQVTRKTQYNTWSMSAEYQAYLYSSTTFEYDSLGNVTSAIESKPDGAVLFDYKTEYKYDSKGNWIEKLTFKNGLPESKLVRRLYYKK
jgi:hypothetical protein